MTWVLYRQATVINHLAAAVNCAITIVFLFIYVKHKQENIMPYVLCFISPVPHILPDKWFCWSEKTCGVHGELDTQLVIVELAHFSELLQVRLLQIKLAAKVLSGIVVAPCWRGRWGTLWWLCELSLPPPSGEHPFCDSNGVRDLETACYHRVQCMAKTVSPNFFAIFLATAWNFYMKFHTFIAHSWSHKTAKQYCIIFNYDSY